MTVQKALYSRYSCRRFLDRKVSRVVLDEILSDALQAPSCENSQPWQVFVAGPKAMEQIRQGFRECWKAKRPMDLDRRFDGKWSRELRPRVDAYFNELAEHSSHDSYDAELQLPNLFYAPMMIYLCLNHETPTWSVFDIGIFAQSIMLLATEQGLSTMISAASVAYPEVVRRVLSIPKQDKIMIGIGMGYSDKDHEINSFRSTRKGLDEVRYVP